MHPPLINGTAMSLAIAFLLFVFVPNDLWGGGSGVGVVLADSFTVGDRFRDCSVCPEMVVLPLSAFEVNSASHEIGQTSGENLQGEIDTAGAIAMSLYEIKISEWKNCAAAGACAVDTHAESEGGSEFGWREWKRTHPVVGVTWEESKEYTSWLTVKTGSGYRLPTEAEWEHAALGGTDIAQVWEALEGAACEYANLEGSSGCADGDGYDELAPVGSYRANAFGIYDMLGNAAEWTENCWGKSDEFDRVDGAEQRPSAKTVASKSDVSVHASDCNQKVYRGGAWTSTLEEVRSGNRAGLDKDVKSDFVGFRVVRVLP